IKSFAWLFRHNERNEGVKPELIVPQIASAAIAASHWRVSSAKTVHRERIAVCITSTSCGTLGKLEISPFQRLIFSGKCFHVFQNLKFKHDV
ncbi:hypothetical protein, partial [Klebsiella pneumoniae]|uniref:hypothetical protein n=1 Tax=Klebsiella pneumoniae TaxID=573 RepID=UPI003C74E0D0